MSNLQGSVESLKTPIQPSGANHCYNGILFNIRAKEFAAVEILSISLGGWLDRVSVFSCKGGWHGNEAIPSRWTKVSSHNLARSWNKCSEIVLGSPVLVSPSTVQGFYVHSESHSERAIQYQSASNYDKATCENQFIQILPGKGHTSPIAFDQIRGWWRGPRTLAGGVKYRVIMNMWSPKKHREFPKEFQQGIFFLLLCHHRSSSVLHHLPKHVLLHVLTFLSWNSFAWSIPPEPANKWRIVVDALQGLLQKLPKPRGRSRTLGKLFLA